jgi:hypothetical protein
MKGHVGFNPEKLPTYFGVLTNLLAIFINIMQLFSLDYNENLPPNERV